MPKWVFGVGNGTIFDCIIITHKSKNSCDFDFVIFIPAILIGFAVPRDYVIASSLFAFPGLETIRNARRPLGFDLEITARCNSRCRHCYINLPENDQEACQRELSFQEIDRFSDESVAQGALWCLITGGEPLLREDFPDIYLMLRRKGLLVSIFTNATLITKHHIDLFKRYPPRNIEVTVYGITRETYGNVTRKPALFSAFQRGMDLLWENHIPMRLKAMALRSNLHEIRQIAAFCRQRTRDYFRFDPVLHLRNDGNASRNDEIHSERLSPHEVVDLELSDEERMDSLLRHCHDYISGHSVGTDHQLLFKCGAGIDSYTIGYDGQFRLCSSLNERSCVYNLRNGSLADAWNEFVPKVRSLHSSNPEVQEKCLRCNIISLCLWCPAHAHLENGKMDSWCEYFCRVAHERAEMIKRKLSKPAIECD